MRYRISDRLRTPFFVALNTTIVVAALCSLAFILINGLRSTLDERTRETLNQYLDLRVIITRTLDALDAVVTAEPCSEPYFEQLREVAYLPDGINEFFHVVDNQAVCSVNQGWLDSPFDLGPPDIEVRDARTVGLWFDRELGFVGLDGIIGSLVREDDTVLVVPIQPLRIVSPDWLEYEILVRSAGGELWHRSGTPGLFATAAAQPGSFPRWDGGVYGKLCDGFGLHCVATRANIVGYMIAAALDVLALAIVVSVLAGLLIWAACTYLRRHWSFPERFKRNLESGIVCVYQPIVNVATGAIIGCEVLARWRDRDGVLALPDSFLPLVERENLTVRLSRAVVRQGVNALAGRVSNRPLQVNFNIFPRDFDSQALERIFPVDLDYGVLSITAELVETEFLAIDHIQAAIAYLASRGISTYIDDFGTGYSNLQNLALLDIDGIKIDRSFAMASKNSMMERIMDHAIEMAGDLGRVTIIEGVETLERYGMLKANPQVRCVQGYFISPPLEIDDFISFIQKWAPPELPMTPTPN